MTREDFSKRWLLELREAYKRAKSPLIREAVAALIENHEKKKKK